jgi:hypothetical protein
LLLLLVILLLLFLHIPEVLFDLAGSFGNRDHKIENELVQQVKQNDIKNESHIGA